ncbi:MAG: ABC transporter ATP-binding protein [Candidatus Marinimicrobia bacterium]|nr:ABC transporter ATP-binding protein [Candidatus Neomarinimicrobiota bacterium]
MNNIAIKVDQISKRYRIGSKVEKHDTLGGALASWLKSPLNNYKRVKKLSDFKSSAEDDIIWALRDISFEVKEGEVLGIIGKNGAGKSTLLKVLAHIIDPTSGSATINGRVASLLEVGTGFHPELTGRENVFLNGTILGMTKSEISSKFDEIVEFSGVEKFLDTPVKRYSSGMRVRLAFSVAAHLEPEILLVDEVLAVGDTGFQQKCIGKMGDVASQGRTVLFVSHNMAAVQSLCSRGILLKNGGVQTDAEIASVVKQYIVDVTTKIEQEKLSDRPDRQSGDKLRIRSVEFFDAETRSPINSALSGQAISIKIAFENLTNSAIGDVNFGLAFYTDHGSFLFACGSRPSGRTYTIQSGGGVVWCDIPKLPLNAGRVRFTVHCDTKKDTLDNVSDAGYLDVEMGDYYGTGLVPAKHLQGVFIDYEFRASNK